MYLIPYLYRDASNYKQTGQIALDAPLSEADLAAIESKLDEGDYFIPHDLKGLGIPELQERAIGFPSEDDHCWHELDLSGAGEGTPSSDAIRVSREQLLAAFAAIPDSSSWDVEGACLRLGV